MGRHELDPQGTAERLLGQARGAASTAPRPQATKRSRYTDGRPHVSAAECRVDVGRPLAKLAYIPELVEKPVDVRNVRLLALAVGGENHEERVGCVLPQPADVGVELGVKP